MVMYDSSCFKHERKRELALPMTMKSQKKVISQNGDYIPEACQYRFEKLSR
uniref:Uncharacterized protein n=1 Tax=Rhizophora mucronata TaxID=61149 RepID=A0A2P2N9A4_RHIMU